MNMEYMNQLINDHAIIEKALVLLERQAAREDKMNPKTVGAILELLWEFGEQFHNQKEEQIYFPILLQKGLPPQGPIAVMLAEHESERNYIKEMRSMLEIYESTGEYDKAFGDTILNYSDLTKNHIWKENDILYPMGRNFINETDNDYLLEQFGLLERDTVGAGGTTRYQTLADSLEKENEGKIDLLASLSTSQINNFLDTLPIELSFVDADDRVRYFNKLEKEKIFTRSLSVIGRTVQQCHPPKSVHMVNQILEEMKAGTRESSEFWINMAGMFLHISYYAVRDSEGKYEGCVEMVHDVMHYRNLEGEKRLLD